MRVSWLQILFLGLVIAFASTATQNLLPRLGWAQGAGFGTQAPILGVVVATCGTGPSYTAGQYAPFTVNTAGLICNNI